LRKYVTLYLVFCVVGFGLEWCYGKFWSTVGTTPWLYADSSLDYTSLEGAPLWGFGGLICVTIYQSFSAGKVKRLLGLIPLLILSAAWILIYVRFIA
jgi:hypothetical protein